MKSGYVNLLILFQNNINYFFLFKNVYFISVLKDKYPEKGLSKSAFTKY